MAQKCTSKGIWRQGIVLKHRKILQKSLCPVFICPYLCSSEWRPAGVLEVILEVREVRGQRRWRRLRRGRLVLPLLHRLHWHRRVHVVVEAEIVCLPHSSASHVARSVASVYISERQRDRERQRERRDSKIERRESEGRERCCRDAVYVHHTFLQIGAGHGGRGLRHVLLDSLSQAVDTPRFTQQEYVGQRKVVVQACQGVSKEFRRLIAQNNTLQKA